MPLPPRLQTQSFASAIVSMPPHVIGVLKGAALLWLSVCQAHHHGWHFTKNESFRKIQFKRSENKNKTRGGSLIILNQRHIYVCVYMHMYLYVYMYMCMAMDIDKAMVKGKSDSLLWF